MGSGSQGDRSAQGRFMAVQATRSGALQVPTT